LKEACRALLAFLKYAAAAAPTPTCPLPTALSLAPASHALPQEKKKKIRELIVILTDCLFSGPFSAQPTVAAQIIEPLSILSVGRRPKNHFFLWGEEPRIIEKNLPRKNVDPSGSIFSKIAVGLREHTGLTLTQER
jgi:hypothetical protein